MPRGIPRNGFRLTKNRIALMKNEAQTKAQASRFDINTRFGFLHDAVTMVATGDQASCIITGEGGLGKSYSVMKALIGAGLKDITDPEFGVGATPNRKAFRVVKGFVTPKSLYTTMYENRNGTLVLDDMDGALKLPESLGLLKAGLDSMGRRIITWRSDREDGEVPSAFEYKGKIVFITNIPYAAIDQAILSRSLVIDVSMSLTEIIDRMRAIIKDKEFMPETEMAHKVEAVNLIDRLKDEAKSLSLRSLIQVVRIRKANPKSWASLAEYVLVG